MAGAGYFEQAAPQLRELIVTASRQTELALANLNSTSELISAADITVSDLCEELVNLKLGILFIRGTLSPVVMQQGFDKTENCLPDHESAVIENAFHYVHVDNPEGFNRAVIPFLDQLRE